MSWIKISAAESLRLDPAAIPADLQIAIIEEDIETANHYSASLAQLQLNSKTFQNGSEFLASEMVHTVWCVIVGNLPCGAPDVELMRQIKGENLGCQVILTSFRASIFGVVEAMKSGAFAVIEKPVKAEVLSTAVQDARRVVHADPFMINRVPQRRRQLAGLTLGERQVLDRLLLGIPHKRIASELDIGLRTVELRKSRVMHKLGVDTFAELIQLVTMIELYEVSGPRRLA